MVTDQTTLNGHASQIGAVVGVVGVRVNDVGVVVVVEVVVEVA